MKKSTKHQSWSDPPGLGDLVEVGHDQKTGKPFIGVITEINHRVGDDSITGRVLVNETVTWVDLYKLKLVKRNHRVDRNEDA